MKPRRACQRLALERKQRSEPIVSRRSRWRPRRPGVESSDGPRRPSRLRPAPRSCHERAAHRARPLTPHAGGAGAAWRCGLTRPRVTPARVALACNHGRSGRADWPDCPDRPYLEALAQMIRSRRGKVGRSSSADLAVDLPEDPGSRSLQALCLLIPWVRSLPGIPKGAAIRTHRFAVVDLRSGAALVWARTPAHQALLVPPYQPTVAVYPSTASGLLLLGDLHTLLERLGTVLERLDRSGDLSRSWAAARDSSTVASSVCTRRWSAR